MSLCTRSFLRKLLGSNVCKYSTVAKLQDVQSDAPSTFRTNESDPSNHTKDHLYKIYTVPEEIRNTLFRHGGYTKDTREIIEAFGEYACLVRKPAIEIMSYLRQTNYSKPVNKYVLYGKHGTGKTYTMSHLVHYAYMQKFILVHAPIVRQWFQFPKEVTNSTSSPGLFDVPVDAALWLIHFKMQNEHLLKELDLQISEDYEWTSWETSKKGTPLLEMVGFGISRTKFATQVISKLLKELKQACIADRCKVFVAINAFNTFYISRTMIRNDAKVWVPASNVTITQPFMDITTADWCNGAIVVTVCAKSDRENRDSDLPRYLLRKEGFDHLDPFVPVLVDNYEEAEFETMIEYYKDRKWIRNVSPKGVKELQFLSNSNPRTLLECTRSL